MNAALRPMTREEFLDWAARQPGRHEFDGRNPVPMTGGTNNHGIIADNLRFELKLRLRGGPCRAMGPDGGGVATAGGRVRYPEAAVTCSPIPGKAHLVPDPIVVFEVVSPSSASMDHVHKLREYHAVPSILRYVLIEQDGIAVTVHARQGEAWTTVPLIDGETLVLPELGVDLPVAAFYDGVTFGETGAA